MNDEMNMQTAENIVTAEQGITEGNAVTAENIVTAEAPAPEKAAPHRKIRSIQSNPVNVTKRVFVYFFLVLFMLWILVPFYIIIITSVKTDMEVIQTNFTWFPTKGFYFGGYKSVFTPMAGSISVLRGFLNTIWIVLPPTIIGLMTSAFAAYAFAKLKFRGKNILFGLLLATMMVPGMVSLVPSFALYNAIGWNQTPLPLMIPGMFGAAACVFYLRQFFMGIPSETLEAARLDGVGYFGMFFKMMLPLAVPALIAQGVLGFVGGYNDYFGPMLYVAGTDYATLQVALASVGSKWQGEWNKLMAATLVALLPTIVIYLVAQRYFIEGIAVSGLK